MTTDSQFAALPASATRGALTIEYRWIEAGRPDAPLAVFLHEGLGSIAMWRDWPQALCARLGMRGLVWSRPGYGRSTPRPHDVRWPVDYLSQQAHDVMPSLLDALGVDARTRERMWVIGHSDGASIALLYAARFPRALAGAVVIAPHEFVEDVSIAGIVNAKTQYETGNLRARLAPFHDDVDSAFYGWSDIWLSQAFRGWNIVDALGAIQCPLLAVQAEDDHYGTMAHLDAIAGRVPHARIHKLAHGGHSPHRDIPDTLDDVIARFVREQSTHAPTRAQ
ncbi:MAG TPA: alpha/beta fold hydrolase [Paraburkholderia sp.]|jgi:pimeloyl-ACP methyl ester carboxylesterase|nr:alpha/beta fold hydrolase [Paraburkholderia sp.]